MVGQICGGDRSAQGGVFVPFPGSIADVDEAEDVLFGDKNDSELDEEEEEERAKGKQEDEDEDEDEPVSKRQRTDTDKTVIDLTD